MKDSTGNDGAGTGRGKRKQGSEGDTRVADQVTAPTQIWEELKEIIRATVRENKEISAEIADCAKSYSRKWLGQKLKTRK